MGLDMYMYKATKPQFNGHKVYNLADLEDDFTCFAANEDGSLEERLSDLRPFLVRLRCWAEYYDVDKITEAFAMPDRARWGGFGPDGIYFHAGEGDSYKSITIPHDAIQNFTIKKQNYFYVTKLEEVGYWRKHYDLDEKLTRHLFSTRQVVVENCGYYRMTKASMKIVDNYTKKHDTEPVLYEPEEVRNLFYHNWY